MNDDHIAKQRKKAQVALVAVTKKYQQANSITMRNRRAIISNPTILETIERFIVEGQDAESAVTKVLDHFAKGFERHGDEHLRDMHIDCRALIEELLPIIRSQP